ncbi:unnamed protein product [Linum trigynum]|uniref:Uncharacterized protein n=1 Tax=Linum trigynum TaxID=586398 RepID=A0AAV2EVM1_9ROSI
MRKNPCCSPSPSSPCSPIPGAETPSLSHSPATTKAPDGKEESRHQYRPGLLRLARHKRPSNPPSAPSSSSTPAPPLAVKSFLDG